MPAQEYISKEDLFRNHAHLIDDLYVYARA